MTRPVDLAARIRRAREERGWTQTQLGVEVGRRLRESGIPISYRTVQTWESGRVPHGRTISALESVLGVDLTSPPPSSPGAPTLDDATETQLLAALANRFADLDREIRRLRQAVSGAGPAGSVTDLPGRWAARERPTE